MTSLVFVNEPNSFRPTPLEFIRAATDGTRHTTNICFWQDVQTERLEDGEIPVFTLIGSERVLKAMNFCRKAKKPFVLIDHPHAGEQRGKMVRITVGGIYPAYNPKAPIWANRTYDWNLQPWRDNQGKVLRWCPSADDVYGKWLRRDQTNTTASVGNRFMELKRDGVIDQDWNLVVDTRFKTEWEKANLDAPPRAKAEKQILTAGALCDGNSEKLLHALRLGVPAFIWRHPAYPLANTLASYAPMTLDLLDQPAVHRIEREPLFEQLAMTQCTLEELGSPTMLRKLVEWQMEWLPAHP